MTLLKWLVPGMNVKRWLVLLFLGMLGGALGLGLVMAYIYRAVPFTGLTSQIVIVLTLQFIPRIERGILLIGLGVGLVVASLFKLSHSLLSVFLPNPRDLVDILPAAQAAARAAHRGHRRRHRPLNAAARPQGVHVEPDR